MSNDSHLSIKIFYFLVGISGLIILLSSFEAILRVKDYEIFLIWAKDNFPLQTIDDSLFSTYVTSELSMYFIKIIIPISISITAFFSLNKIRFSKIFIYIWTVLAIGGFSYTLIELNFKSVFFYSILALYILLVLFIYFSIGLSRESTR